MLESWFMIKYQNGITYETCGNGIAMGLHGSAFVSIY